MELGPGFTPPRPPPPGARLEAKIRGFLWLWRLEKLPLDELYAPEKKGGLGLPNIAAKCDSLRIKHLLRCIKKEGPTRGHLDYWMGRKIRVRFPNLNENSPCHVSTPYFDNCASLILDECIEPEINDLNLHVHTTKSIYLCLNSTPCPPKVENNFERNWDQIWSNLNHAAISCDARNVMFLIVHNIFPNKQRLNRLNGLHPSGFCNICEYVTEDNIHLFTTCPKIARCFEYIKSIFIVNNVFSILYLFKIHQYEQRIVHDRLLHLAEKTHNNTARKIYLSCLSLYCLYVYNCIRSESPPSIRNLKSFLLEKSSFKLKLPD